ncbi:coproporphyrinogen dehydrogenase HemZ [Acidaminobacter hydrogenoformans]|uniref:Oxygen-independent coproporphyrinogen-3 oxidase n=1 Tax=Acidaminobacter hydrogenoformans DSM 2784 TaxID=1120920 RepID=A0A1G5RWY9_9FIRM|nr:coproporphyrinogen dehydrogenase HemZ [Acidaminobacter hydrogenoformans]SCZ78378.1 oxygen-independent coproporphyrinogen-3 oxidase [Acidaminobacter hydrogenoformans DSM 2784]
MIRIIVKFEGFDGLLDFQDSKGLKTNFDHSSCLQDLRVLAGLFVLEAEVVEGMDGGGDVGGQTCVECLNDDGGQTRAVFLVFKMDEAGIEGRFADADSTEEKVVQLSFEAHQDFVGKNLAKNMVKAAFFDLMGRRFEVKTSWGILTGIRPVKLVHDLMDAGFEDSVEIRDYLKRHYRVSEEKIQLAMKVAGHENEILRREHERVSVYLCIPFCATRCLYCSFPSNPMKQKGHLVPAYLEAMVREIGTIGKYLEESGRVVDCVYIGGGTPTSLNESEFEMLLGAVDRLLVQPLSAAAGGLREYTVEAGRPDTITEKKLRDMKRYGVSRVCINPQTMSDATLRRIGRSHDAGAVVEAFELAREIGFEVINADLIVGLPGEAVEDVVHTAEAIRTLRPENITVHTLAVKRASRLNEERGVYERGLEASALQVDAMYEAALEVFGEAGYEAYYLYRQKNMVGNLENVGLTLPGHKCLYNIRMMGDRHSIVAIGAGSVTKLVSRLDGGVERLANAKGVEDYINRIDLLIDHKIEWLTRFE